MIHDEVIRDTTPVRYNGKAVLCVKCDNVFGRFASPGANQFYCHCRHDVRQLETEEAALERRAHWILKRRFEPGLSEEDIRAMMDDIWERKSLAIYAGALTGRFSAKGKSK